MIFNEKQCTFEQLLEKDNSVSMHVRNLQTLAIAMYKVVNGASAEIMAPIFRFREESRYNFGHQHASRGPAVNVVNSGTVIMSFMGSKI